MRRGSSTFATRAPIALAAFACAALLAVVRSPPARSDATVPARDGGVAAPAPAPARCASSSDCAWEDPCSGPHRCRARSELHRPDPSCAQPRTFDDDCRCIDHVCTRIEPHETASLACAGDEQCVFDPVAGECDRGPVGRAATSGPACRCVSRRCRAEFPQPVRCRTWRDCSEYRGAPAPATLWPRTRAKVRPCKDGEHDVICTPDHVCERVAWPC